MMTLMGTHDLAMRMAELARATAVPRRVDDVLVDVTATAKELIDALSLAAGAKRISCGARASSVAPPTTNATTVLSAAAVRRGLIAVPRKPRMWCTRRASSDLRSHAPRANETAPPASRCSASRTRLPAYAFGARVRGLVAIRGRHAAQGAGGIPP